MTDTPESLLKSGLAMGAMGLALTDGSAALAKADAATAQADALRAAAATRQGASQPAALSPDQQYDRAKALLASGDIPGAMAGFRRVLAFDPQSVDAMNGLAITYDRMGRHDVARGWYEAALAIKPDAPSVLSNLGYSLLLAGQPRAAIPWLQAASRGQDPRAAATARRLLSQIAARLTAEAAAIPAQPRPAEIALITPVTPAAPATQLAIRQAPSEAEAAPARIELAANGEARLVLGGAAPAPALVEALGEAATLVLVATPSTTREESHRLAEATPRPPSQVLAVATPQARLVIVEAPALRLDGPLLTAVAQVATTPQPATPQQPEPARTPVTAPILTESAPALTRLAAPTLTLASARPTPMLRATPLPAAPVFPRATTGWQGARDTRLAPAWLITLRRATPHNSPTPASPQADSASSVPAFESDDEALNLFAARHRTDAEPDSPAARQAAIARLEALIARVRRA
jgi:Flp pilus assembly protein TadD